MRLAFFFSVQNNVAQEAVSVGLVAGNAGHLAFLVFSMAREAGSCLVVNLEGGDKFACFPGVQEFDSLGGNVTGQAGAALFPFIGWKEESGLCNPLGIGCMAERGIGN